MVRCPARVVARTFLATAVATLTLGCQRAPVTDVAGPSFRMEAAGVDWELVELDGQAPPPGAGGRRATLRFEREAPRMGGFAGCNQYGGNYTMRGAELRFTDVSMTMMACETGMDLERGMSRMLRDTRRWAMGGGELTLFDETRSLARFERREP